MKHAESNPNTPATPEEKNAALWANLVLQQSNMALMFLGKVPGPGDKSPKVDLPTASMFVDTLEMLAAKTRGNLAANEKEILTQTLTSLRLAFVEAANAASGTGPGPGEAAKAPATAGSEGPAAGEPMIATEDADASKKKFSKKY